MHLLLLTKEIGNAQCIEPRMKNHPPQYYDETLLRMPRHDAANSSSSPPQMKKMMAMPAELQEWKKEPLMTLATTSEPVAFVLPTILETTSC